MDNISGRATTWAKKSTFSRFLDQVVNNGDYDIVDTVFHPDFVGSMPESDKPYTGRNGARRWSEELRAGFTDLNTLIEGGWLIAEDDAHHIGRGTVAERVAAYVVIRGRHTGPYAGIPATGRPVTFSQVHLLRFDSSLVVDDVAICDRLSLLQQLGYDTVPGTIAGPHLPAELI